jgi:hypothetical protein
MKSTLKKPLALDARMLKAIQRMGRGAVFVPTDFLNIGDRGAIDVALHRFVRKGVIRRLARGVYDFPKDHSTLGRLYPSVETVARVMAGRDKTRLQPAGAYAANILGLSEQVPAKVVFLTDGPSRTVKIGQATIRLRRTTAKNMACAERLSGLLIQSLRELGEKQMTPERLLLLKRTIPANKRKELLKDIRLAPAWMHPIFRYLAGEVG